MIKNYVKVAFRMFWRNKLFTLINVFGLSIGLSAALVVYLIVHFDFTFDKHHLDGDRIYRVVTEFSFQGRPFYGGGVTGPMAEAVRSEVSGVESSAPFYIMSPLNVQTSPIGNSSNQFKNQSNIVLADGRYFDMFPYKWLAGTAQTALNAPYQVVLSTEAVKKYFGDLPFDQVIGKTIFYDTIGTTVTGIVQTPTDNTDFTFHDFLSYSTGSANKSLANQLQLTNWESGSTSFQLFVKLFPKTKIARIEDALNSVLNKNKPKTAQNRDDIEKLHLQQLGDLHFSTDYGNFEGGRVVNKTTLSWLTAIAGFLLLLACINFVNLTTAQSVTRAKEIGIRKTIGSNRRQLIFQFLSETFLITVFAVIIAIVLAPIILNLFADFVPSGVKIAFSANLLVFMGVLTLSVSFAAGFYPSILLSRHKPVSVLKNQNHTGTGESRRAWLRKFLTVAQFIIAQFFLMITFLVSKQIYYALHKDLGFRKDGIVIVKTPVKSEHDMRSQIFLNKVKNLYGIELVSAGHTAPSSTNTDLTEATFHIGSKDIITDVQQKFGDENYIRVYKIKLLAGRNLRQSDSSGALLINNTYARTLGFDDPAKAVGIFLDYNDKKMQVAGVVADFHEKSLHMATKPMAILTSHDLKYNSTIHIALKTFTPGGGDWSKTLGELADTWKQIYPGEDFHYQFFDQSIAQFYETEQHAAKLLNWASGISILISCLGLLGLAVYTTNQRTKEIGVRKVLGASVLQIVSLLSAEIVLLVAVSFLIVTPLAWWSMNEWMQSFSDRTPISWWIFGAPGLGLLLITMATSASQTIKAALTNPVKSLRSE